MASGLSQRDEEYQINLLLYITGEKSDDVLKTLPLEEAKRKKYDKVCKALGEHFIGKHNVDFNNLPKRQRTSLLMYTDWLSITNMASYVKKL